MFYDRFVELCDRHGVTVSRAAVDSGINKSAVTYWKNAPEAMPSGNVAEKLCKYFGITMSELYNDAIVSRQESQELTFDDFTYAMHGASGTLSDDEKDVILNMAKQFEAARKLREKHEDSE